MNLRILKKLSKRAAPLLPLLGETRKQFPAEKGDSYTGVCNIDWKHRERWPAKHPFERFQKYMPKHGKHWIMFYVPAHPFKGTVMVGEMSGYYEPEWSEQTAWEALREHVYWHFTEMVDVTDSTGDAEWPHPICKRDLSTPTLVFKAAQEIIERPATQEGGDKEGEIK